MKSFQVHISVNRTEILITPITNSGVDREKPGYVYVGSGFSAIQEALQALKR